MQKKNTKNKKTKVKSAKSVVKNTKKKAQIKKRGRKKVVPRAGLLRWPLYFFIAVAILLLVGVGYYSFVRPVISDAHVYTIEPGDSISSVARDLGQGDLFKFFIMINGDKVKVGQYDIPAGASVWRIADMVANGKVATVTITVQEGLTVKQISNLLSKNDFLTGQINISRYKDGQLFPDTYIIAKGTNRQAVMDLMARDMERVRARLFGKNLPEPLKNWDDVIILASIVQKETPKKEEMPLVASVYLNRLRIGMRLQADPTVVYAITNGLGDMQERRLYLKHLQIDSPYNTYRNKGLPPAPIANVGMDAIMAVLNPAETEYLFFVADGTGGHTFAKTHAEHEQNRAKWREIKKRG